MNDPFDQMSNAISEAESLMKSVDKATESMAKLMVGRMRKVSCYRLKKLKRELKDFNMHTCKWKEEK
jgi:hypothetical protein